MSITATPGASANSYISVEAANDYFHTRMHSEPWAAADVYSRNKALTTATRILDGMAWCGLKSDSANSLRWPRSGVLDKDGYTLSSSTIPSFLEQATADLALDLLVEDASKANPQAIAPLKKAKLGALEAEWAVSEPEEENTIQSGVRVLIGFYLAAQGHRILRA
ncbi:MAG: hypothetical protein COB36_10735 [Alphaproteobacteria bacterium]|nr:MAG: hypothetical protein COB36_10735 [Alphaproteobacteria bacterium]